MIFIWPKDLANKLGITVHTLQKWDRHGKLPAHRTVTNQRYYTMADYYKAINETPPKQRKRRTVIYARVSTYSQKDDLQRQVRFLRQYINAKGIIPKHVLKEIGSGMNYRRRKWNHLIKWVVQGKVSRIYVAYPDRFTRFGFSWFQKFFKEYYHTALINIRNKDLSPQQEVLQDLISIIHVFSCRLYGLRKYKTKMKNDKTLKKESEK